MQIRKTCNHPYIFENVEDPSVEEFGEHLVTNSGKMIFVLTTSTKSPSLKGTMPYIFTIHNYA